MARRVVALAPDQSQYWNTLGVALYRAGRFVEAVEVLEQSLARGGGVVDAFDLFFLAMAHHDLGRPGRARTCHDQAVQWWDRQKGLPPRYVQWLSAIRAEAEAILTGASEHLPADVFAPR